MILKLDDRVYAKTEIIRCTILGTIKQSHEDKVLVIFDHPIKNKKSAWVARANCTPITPPKNIEVKNRKMKNRATRVIGGLEVIK